MPDSNLLIEGAGLVAYRARVSSGQRTFELASFCFRQWPTQIQALEQNLGTKLQLARTIRGAVNLTEVR